VDTTLYTEHRFHAAHYVDNHEMVEAARRVVHRLGGTGFFGFDFVLEETSGRPFPIEINPAPRN
jgi:D-alanine-D-alanine ligase-like ATP-grasp enzyme